MAKKLANYAWERLSQAIWRASVWEEAAAICEFFGCLYPTLPPQQRDLLLSLQHVPKSKLCHIPGKQRLYQLFSQPEPDTLKACHGNASWLRTHPDLLVRRGLCGKGKPLEAVSNLNYKGYYSSHLAQQWQLQSNCCEWSWGRKASRNMVQLFLVTQI